MGWIRSWEWGYSGVYEFRDGNTGDPSRQFVEQM